MFYETVRRISSIAERHRGKKYTPESFIRLLRAQFRDPRLRFHLRRSKKVSKSQMLLGGEYDPHADQEGEACVHVYITYNDRQRIEYIDKVDWYNLAFHLADVVCHEYLHQYYIRKRGYKFGKFYRRSARYLDSMQDYLGCEDEILCYGFSAAAEALYFDQPLEKTKVYKKYKKFFNEDPQVIGKLKKQAVKYIKALETNHDKSSKRRARRGPRDI